jgi:hypothetical protein
MSKKQPSQLPPDEGARRASEFAQLFSAFPGHSDDSMSTITRNPGKAKHIMPKTHHDRFIAAMNGLTAIWVGAVKPATAPTDPGAGGGGAAAAAATGGGSQAQTPACDNPHAGETVVERARRTAELRREATEAVKAYPELAGDFDRFCIASRAAIRAVGSHPSK